MTTSKPSQGGKRQRVLQNAATIALLLAVAVALTWPLAADLDGGIPLGTETVATVPLASLWSLWWNADRAAERYSGYWDAPIFHPSERAFAFSETHTLHGAVGRLLYGVVGSWPATYNLLLLLTLTLNGWTAHRLLRFVGTRGPAALAGGVLAVALPFVHQELGVFALVQIWGVTASIHAALRFAESPSPRRGALLGALVGVSYLLCGYYGVMTAVLLGLTLPVVLAPRLRERATWQGIAAGTIVAALLTLPIALPQRSATRSEGFERSVETVAKHSARPRDFTESAWPTLLPSPGEVAAEPSERAFWPGTATVILAGIGWIWMLGQADRRRWGLALTAIGVLGFVLSLGPHGNLGPTSIYDLLRRVLPGYGQMRALFRFAVAPQLVAALFAACGVQACLELARRRKVRSAALPPLLATALTLFAVIDARPQMGGIQPLPPLSLDLEWVEWIEQEAEHDAVLAFIPFPAGRSSGDYLGTAQWMYWQMRHGRTMVNGYSSFFPRAFLDLKADVAEFPRRQAIDSLRDRGVEYVIVHRAFVPERLRGTSFGSSRLEHLATDHATGIDIYRLD